ncbi:hypothetical protein KXV85_004425, partial [Aspergillus fumigatus]
EDDLASSSSNPAFAIKRADLVIGGLPRPSARASSPAPRKSFHYTPLKQGYGGGHKWKWHDIRRSIFVRKTIGLRKAFALVRYAEERTGLALRQPRARSESRSGSILRTSPRRATSLRTAHASALKS